MVPATCSFALVEVEVYAADDPDTNVALGKPADQKSVHPTASHPGTQGHRRPHRVAPIARRPRFSIDHTREVLARAARLAARLEGAGRSGAAGPARRETGR
jgi:hypothetical protein